MRKFFHWIVLVVLFFYFSINPALSNKKKSDVGLGFEKTNPNLAASFKSGQRVEKQEGIPSEVDLASYFPTPGNQGQQGSCVAWSVAYAVKTYHEKIERNWDIKTYKTIFSPAYIYNQIKLPMGGSYIHEALEVVKNQGVATWQTMPYDYRDDKTKPDAKARQEASLYKAKSWKRISVKDRQAIKRELAAGNPVIFGMRIFESFYNYTGGVYKKQSGGNLGGHAMVLIGYSDSKQAYRVFNSWGTDWGDKGYAWIDYELFEKDTLDAYIMYDERENKPTENKEIPKNVSASQGTFGDYIHIIWDANNNTELYRVYRAEKGSKNYIEIGSTADNEFFDRNVEKNKVYLYTVRSVNRNGLSDYSDIAEGFLAQQKEEEVFVGQPQNLTARVANQIVYLSWNSVEEATGYYILRFDEAKGDFVQIGESKTSFYQDKNVKPGNTYYYTVKAYNEKVTSEMSNSAMVELPKMRETLPESPKNFRVSQGDYPDKIVLSWDKAEGALLYYILRWNPNNWKWERLATTKNLFYEDRNVSENTSYYYVIYAANILGFSLPTRYKNGHTSKMASAASNFKKIESKTYIEKANEFVYQNLENKGLYKSVIPFRDLDGKKIKDEFYYVEKFIEENGYYKTIAYYDEKGGFLTVERYYTEGFAKNKGYDKTITYYDGDLSKRLKMETFYTPQFVEEKGIERRIVYFDGNGEIYKTERIFGEKEQKTKNIGKIIYYHGDKLKVIRTEWYDPMGNKIRETIPK